MDHIIFEDPLKRVSHKNIVGNYIALPIVRYNIVIKQAAELIDPYFSPSANFDVYIHSNKPVSLYNMFSLLGDKKIGNKDYINESLQALSQGNIYAQQEWSISYEF